MSRDENVGPAPKPVAGSVTWHVLEATETGHRVGVKLEWCKGCGICIAVCDHNVLVMRDGKAIPENIGACTVCRACEEHCPDFALKVEKGQKKGAKP